TALEVAILAGHLVLYPSGIVAERLAPDGERIVRVPGSTRHPDGRYVSTGGLLAGLVLLALAETVARLWGR
ncbi:hypothetical protein ACWEPZ_37830, partial [Streptomyces sp. NPDC004288]